MRASRRSFVLLGAVLLCVTATSAGGAGPRFARGLSVALPRPPRRLLATELSGDHHPDVLVAAGELVALRNTGDGDGYQELAAGAYHRERLDEAEAAFLRADDRGDAAGASNLGVLLQQRGAPPRSRSSRRDRASAAASSSSSPPSCPRSPNRAAPCSRRSRSTPRRSSAASAFAPCDAPR